MTTVSISDPTLSLGTVGGNQGIGTREEACKALRTAIRFAQSGNHPKALDLIESIALRFPYLTEAMAWRLALRDRAGLIDDHRRAELVETIATYTDLEHFKSSHPDSRLLSLTGEVQSNGQWTSPSKGMPIINGDKTGDLTGSAQPSLIAFSARILECFIQYIAQRLTLRDVIVGSTSVSIHTWAVRLRQGGRIDAHYHPTSFLSSVYYPYDRNTDSSTTGTIEFGVFPPEMNTVPSFPPIQLPRTPGSVVVFPSWLGHRVLTTSSMISVSIGSDFHVYMK